MTPETLLLFSVGYLIGSLLVGVAVYGYVRWCW